MVDSNPSRIDSSHALRLIPTVVWKADRGSESCQRINRSIFRWLTEQRESLPNLGAGQAWQSDQVVVKVGDGTLLVFPSWLAHSVDANQSDQERISVSFNVMFSSYTETMSGSLWEA